MPGYHVLGLILTITKPYQENMKQQKHVLFLPQWPATTEHLCKPFQEIKLVIYWILLFNLLAAKTIKALLMFTHAMFAFYAK